METKEYIVALKDGVDYDQFWAEMESSTIGLPHIPNRIVDIANNRTAFKRICEYALTDAEAEILRNDHRVAAVEIPVRNNPNVTISNNSTPSLLDKNFNKPRTISYAVFDSTGPEVNWGLVRHISTLNNYKSDGTTTEKYSYRLDGTGVDIVINDSGLQVNHPEFEDRVTLVNWNLSEVNEKSQIDTDGHGTHVAGIAAGKTYGWAKGANIIPLYYGIGDYNSNGEPLDIFEALITWHNNKPIDPVTGVKRPTVVNMSWKLTATIATTSLAGGKYRDNLEWSATGKTQTFFNSIGLIRGVGGQGPVQNETNPIRPLVLPFTSIAYNNAMAELIDAGIIVVQAAGNDGMKVDVPGGLDYNNYIISSIFPGKFYYHRGTSPSDPRVIVVGNIDNRVTMSGTEIKDLKCVQAPASPITFFNVSNSGPRIDVWAAGTNIMSACSTINNRNGQPYQHGNSNFKQATLSGTSMAAPQVAGMCALYLQKYPAATPEEVREWIRETAIKGKLYTTGKDDDYSNLFSLLGSTAGVAYQNLEGLDYSYVKDNNSWKKVKATYVYKNGKWLKVKTAYQQKNGTWEKIYQL